MKDGRTIDCIVREIGRQSRMKRDLLVPAPKMSLWTGDAQDCHLVLEGPEAGGQAPMTEFACMQLAKNLDIPAAYFRKMRQHEPDLLDMNVNRWLTKQVPTRYLVRTLDNTVRAILSNRYRRLDNFDLVEALLPTLTDLPEASFESVELTERRLYIKVVCRSVSSEIRPGDIVYAGVIISNSEIGVGSTYVKPLIYRLVCKNGLIVEDRTLTRYHTGRAIGDDAENIEIFADDTRRADDQAFFLRMRDIVQAAISSVTFTMLSEKLKRTLDIQLKGTAEGAVQVLANRYSMDDTEREGVLLRLLAQRDMSGYGLVNAVTEYSQEISNYDRATEFEEIGGKLLALSDGEWKRFAIAE